MKCGTDHENYKLAKHFILFAQQLQNKKKYKKKFSKLKIVKKEVYVASVFVDVRVQPVVDYNVPLLFKLCEENLV